jgi:ferrous iron transport protein A
LTYCSAAYNKEHVFIIIVSGHYLQGRILQMTFWWTKKKCSHDLRRCHGANCRKECPSLSEVNPGKCVCIKRHRSCGAARQRLLDLGIIPSALVNVINKAPLGGAIYLRVGGTNLVLSSSEAALIDVDLVSA